MGDKEMDFVFVCPNRDTVFKSDNFRIIENNGVKTDDDGNKTLDAKVVLNEPCPFCGQHHVYQAQELLCPFEG